MAALDNKTIAGIFYETADLMEVNGDDSFRIRSYRNAAEAIDGLGQQVAELIGDPKQVLAIPGIGKGMLLNLQELFKDGKLTAHQELLTKYRPSMLELLKIQGLGPKSIALIWSAFEVSDLEGVEKLAREGKLRTLPRMSEKTEQKILKSIETYRLISGRFHLDVAADIAEKLTEHLSQVQGVERITPAGSLRRGRETVGDLDILITGKCCVDNEMREVVIEQILRFPGIVDVLAKGANKVSFKLRSGMQVDVRLLAPEAYGAALQYFTGSKSHNVALRQRALKMGYTLNEYGIFRLADASSLEADIEESGNSLEGDIEISSENGGSLEAGVKRSDESAKKAGKKSNGTSKNAAKNAKANLKTELAVAARTEEEIYATLGLDYIPPELRENCGEIEAAANHSLPRLIEVGDLRGDVHMHTVETDGRCTIEEMAMAARERGYEYMAITDHSKNLAFANGLDDKRAEEHIKRIRRADEQIEGIKIFAGIEVDILADGELDLSDSVLEQMDIVIASVHSAFNQEPAKMTDRILRAIENKNTSIIGHPTGRLLLRRDAFQFDMDAVLKSAAKNNVAMEQNAYPDRLDLCDLHLRMAKERGVKIVINTDSHHTSHMEKIKWGVLQARRAWLTKEDVLNTLPVGEFAKTMKR